MGPVRMEVQFRGQVQGVGFRFTAQRAAARFRVIGYVRNLADGSVELVAEGERSELEELLAAIRTSQLAGCIREVTTRWEQARGGYTGFGIRY